MGCSKGLSHQECRERAESIAIAVRGGDSVAVVARRFGVTNQTVFNACRAHGVPGRQAARIGDVALRAVAGLLQGRRQCDVASELGVSRQRVHQIQQRAVRAGFVFPQAKESADV